MDSVVSLFAQDFGISIWMLVVLLIWTVVWKAIALWKSARLNQPVWFILLIVINTLGILEILYIFVFSNISRSRNRRRRK